MKKKKDRWQLVDLRRRPPSSARTGRGATFGGSRDTTNPHACPRAALNSAKIVVEFDSNFIGSLINNNNNNKYIFN